MTHDDYARDDWDEDEAYDYAHSDEARRLSAESALVLLDSGADPETVMELVQDLADGVAYFSRTGEVLYYDNWVWEGQAGGSYGVSKSGKRKNLWVNRDPSSPTFGRTEVQESMPHSGASGKAGYGGKPAGHPNDKAEQPQRLSAAQSHIDQLSQEINSAKIADLSHETVGKLGMAISGLDRDSLRALAEKNGIKYTKGKRATHPGLVGQILDHFHPAGKAEREQTFGYGAGKNRAKTPGAAPDADAPEAGGASAPEQAPAQPQPPAPQAAAAPAAPSAAPTPQATPPQPAAQPKAPGGAPAPAQQPKTTPAAQPTPAPATAQQPQPQPQPQNPQQTPPAGGAASTPAPAAAPGGVAQPPAAAASLAGGQAQTQPAIKQFTDDEKARNSEKRDLERLKIEDMRRRVGELKGALKDPELPPEKHKKITSRMKELGARADGLEKRHATEDKHWGPRGWKPPQSQAAQSEQKEEKPEEGLSQEQEALAGLAEEAKRTGAAAAKPGEQPLPLPRKEDKVPGVANAEDFDVAGGIPTSERQTQRRQQLEEARSGANAPYQEPEKFSHARHLGATMRRQAAEAGGVSPHSFENVSKYLNWAEKSHPQAVLDAYEGFMGTPAPVNVPPAELASEILSHWALPRGETGTGLPPLFPRPNREKVDWHRPSPSAAPQPKKLDLPAIEKIQDQMAEHRAAIRGAKKSGDPAQLAQNQERFDHLRRLQGELEKLGADEFTTQDTGATTPPATTAAVVQAQTTPQPVVATPAQGAAKPDPSLTEALDKMNQEGVARARQKAAADAGAGEKPEEETHLPDDPAQARKELDLYKQWVDFYEEQAGKAPSQWAAANAHEMAERNRRHVANLERHLTSLQTPVAEPEAESGRRGQTPPAVKPGEPREQSRPRITAEELRAEAKALEEDAITRGELVPSHVQDLRQRAGELERRAGLKPMDEDVKRKLQQTSLETPEQERARQELFEGIGDEESGGASVPPHQAEAVKPTEELPQSTDGGASAPSPGAGTAPQEEAQAVSEPSPSTEALGGATEQPEAVEEQPAEPQEATPEEQSQVVAEEQPRPEVVPHLKKIRESLARAGQRLTPEQRQNYGSAARQVLNRMTSKALEQYGANVTGHDFFPDAESFNNFMADQLAEEGFHKEAEERRKRTTPLGSYGRTTRRLRLDGGATKPKGEEYGFETGDVQDVYAHEFAHAIDGPKKVLSSSAAWQEAIAHALPGQKSINDGGLTNYATKDSEEAFAEFGRLLLSGKHDHGAVKAAFPRAFAFWVSHGLIDDVPADKVAPRPELAEVIDEKQSLPDGSHVDAKLKASPEAIATAPEAGASPEKPKTPVDPVTAMEPTPGKPISFEGTNRSVAVSYMQKDWTIDDAQEWCKDRGMAAPATLDEFLKQLDRAFEGNFGKKFKYPAHANRRDILESQYKHRKKAAPAVAAPEAATQPEAEAPPGKLNEVTDEQRPVSEPKTAEEGGSPAPTVAPATEELGAGAGEETEREERQAQEVAGLSGMSDADVASLTQEMGIDRETLAKIRHRAALALLEKSKEGPLSPLDAIRITMQILAEHADGGARNAATSPPERVPGQEGPAATKKGEAKMPEKPPEAAPVRQEPPAEEVAATAPQKVGAYDAAQHESLRSVRNQLDHKPYKPLSDEQRQALVDAGFIGKGKKLRFTDAGRKALLDLDVHRESVERADVAREVAEVNKGRSGKTEESAASPDKPGRSQAVLRSLDDKALNAAIAQGESGALDVALERYSAGALQTARAILADKRFGGDVEDAAQEALRKVLEAIKAGKYDPAKNNLKAYLNQAARRAAIDVVRGVGRSAATGDEEALGAAGDKSAGPERQAHSNETSARVREVLDRLKATGVFDDRDEAIVKAIQNDEPLAPLVEQFGGTPQAIQQRKKKVLEILREELAGEEPAPAPPPTSKGAAPLRQSEAEEFERLSKRALEVGDPHSARIYAQQAREARGVLPPPRKSDLQTARGLAEKAAARNNLGDVADALSKTSKANLQVMAKEFGLNATARLGSQSLANLLAVRLVEKFRSNQQKPERHGAVETPSGEDQTWAAKVSRSGEEANSARQGRLREALEAMRSLPHPEQISDEDALEELASAGLLRGHAAEAMGLPKDAGDEAFYRTLKYHVAGDEARAKAYADLMLRKSRPDELRDWVPPPRRLPAPSGGTELDALYNAHQAARDAYHKMASSKNLDALIEAGDAVRQARRKEKAERIKPEQEWRKHPSLAPLGKKLTVEKADHPAVQKHLAHLSRVPEALSRAVAKHVNEVAVGMGAVPTLDDLGYLKGQKPRGWDDGDTWDEVAGCYEPVSRVVAAGVGRTGSVSLALHEYGHGVDHALKSISTTDAFRRLHSKLYDKLAPYHKQGGRGGEAGCSELFAEGFAEILMDRDNAVRFYGDEFVSWMEKNVLGEIQE